MTPAPGQAHHALGAGNTSTGGYPPPPPAGFVCAYEPGVGELRLSGARISRRDQLPVISSRCQGRLMDDSDAFRSCLPRPRQIGRVSLEFRICGFSPINDVLGARQRVLRRRSAYGKARIEHAAPVSHLRGRGGARRPTARSWARVAQAPTGQETRPGRPWRAPGPAWIAGEPCAGQEARHQERHRRPAPLGHPGERIKLPIR